MRCRSALAALALLLSILASSGCRGRLLRDPDPVYCQPVQCQPVPQCQGQAVTTTVAQPCVPCQPVVVRTR